MRLVVFGATRGTGRQVVEQALAAGHAVTAVVRRPSALAIRHEGLNVIQGDVLEPETFAQAIAGQDAVISTLGVTDRQPTTLYSEGIANVIRAMQTGRVRRLMCVSASGLEPGPLWQRLIAKSLLWTVFKHGYTDLLRMETAVKRSGLDWTIVRPPRLTDGPRTGHYETAVNKHLMRGWFISRADLAGYMLTQLADPASYCGVIEIAHNRGAA